MLFCKLIHNLTLDTLDIPSCNIWHCPRGSHVCNGCLPQVLLSSAKSVNGPPACLSRDFRVRTHPCIWSGAPEPVPCASCLPFLALFISPALCFPPTCHVHLPPPLVTHTTSPQHSDEASVPSLSPDHVPSLVFAQASACIRRMSSLPTSFLLEHSDHVRSSRRCMVPQVPHESGPTQVSGSILLAVRVEHNMSSAPQHDHVTVLAPLCSSPFLVTMLIFPLHWFSSTVWCSFHHDSTQHVCAASLLVSRSHFSIGPCLVLCFLLAPGGFHVGKSVDFRGMEVTYNTGVSS